MSKNNQYNQNKVNKVKPKKNKAKYEPKNKNRQDRKDRKEDKPIEPLIDEFPTLAEAAEVAVPEKTHTKRSDRQPKASSSYTVATSYTQKLRERYGSLPQPRRTTHRDTPRDLAFATLENKEALVKTLECTKACRHVIEGTKEVEDAAGQKQIVYGICYRDVCTFAHSLEELQDPVCTFGAGCRFVHRPKGNGEKCRFRHPFETREMYIERVGVVNRPNLPETAERKVRPRVALRDDKIAEVEAFLQANKETLLRVPKEMFEKTMEMALCQGLSNVRIEITE